MSIWYRASQSSEIKIVFSGDGGLFTAGRWHYLGRKVIYFSQHISLCTLEWLSHNGLSVSGFNYYRYSIEIPDKLIKIFYSSDLPKEWNLTPATDVTRDFAEKNLFLSGHYIGLAFPSVIIPEEFNLVLNPLHQDFSAILKSVVSLGKYSAPMR